MRCWPLVPFLALASCEGPGWLRRMPPCPVTRDAQPPSDWSREDQGAFSIRLPPSCKEHSDAPQFPHGGTRWQCGSIQVTLAWGMWGPDEDRKQCRTTRASVPIVVTAGRAGSEETYGARYVTGFVHEPYVSVVGRPDDRDAIRMIARSGTLYVERGPHRNR